KIHPGLYTYATPTEYETFFKELLSGINRPLTQVEFYRRTLPLHNLIRNGHTLIIPPEKWSQAVEEELPHFPFDIYPDDGKLYVLRNLSEEKSIKAGAEIVSINGESGNVIFQELVDHWTKDGYNQTYPIKIVSQDFSEFYANLLGTPKNFELQIRENDKLKNLIINGLSIGQMRTYSQERYQHEKRPWYNDNTDQSYHFTIEGTTATLILPTFAFSTLEDYKIDYRKYFREAFAKIKEQGVTDLIIDVRENGGGMGDVATELFSYLHDEPFQLLEEVYSKTNKPPSKKFFSGSMFSLRLQMLFALKKVAKDRYVPKPFAAKKNGLSLDLKQPADIHYEGRLYVLTSGWTFSASAMFTSLVKNYQRGIFIGEEAGGNPYVQVGDFNQMLKLPTSGMRMSIPLFYEKMKVNYENTGHGVMPDYPVRASIEDLLVGRDAVMEFVLDLIEKGRE
ncbi:MAG: S41 family peptidase, partial [Saprospiraceae bacterium]